MRADKCVQIALGGVFSSLCLLLMFLSSMIPFSSVAMPMMAGATLVVVVIENGGKTAMLVYVSVSLLSVFIVPDPDAKLLFISFFGYYAALKPVLEQLPGKILSILAKLLVFNAAVICGYFIALNILGLGEAYGESDFLGQYAPAFVLAAGNFSFLIYDFLLTRYITFYLGWFRPTFLRR